MFKNLFILILLISIKSFAQVTPNIGFENGTFDGWDCKVGAIDGNGVITLSASGPAGGRQTMFSRLNNSKMLDPYGNFPVVCPNGSNYSIRLGNEETGAQAESVSYTLTVPTTDDYSVVFYYAVVLQNPSHLDYQQPKFTMQVFDITDNKYIDCPVFNFVAGTSLPGFKLATPDAGSIANATDVYYKDWSTATIDLHAYPGKQMRIEFTTNDCTKGGHFGYAYLDVGEGLSGIPITGNSYCASQTSITLKGPTGFAGYAWYTADMSTFLGGGQSITIDPAPPNLTKYALQIAPYLGLGCTDILYTVINKIDEGFNLSVVNTVHGCTGSGADLTDAAVTAGSSAGMTYSYYIDPLGTNFVHDPTAVFTPGTYYINGINAEGCTATKAVQVSIDPVAVSITNPAAVTYPAAVDLSKTFTAASSLTYTYYKDAAATVPVTNYTAIDHSGTFYIKAANPYGCFDVEPVVVVVNPPPPYVLTAPNVFTPNNDGVNDYFGIKLEGYVKFGLLTIFNRYGQLVYTAKSIDNLWDGNFNGRPLPPGTYYWVFDGTDQYYFTKVTKGGSITIVR